MRLISLLIKIFLIINFISISKLSANSFQNLSIPNSIEFKLNNNEYNKPYMFVICTDDISYISFKEILKILSNAPPYISIYMVVHPCSDCNELEEMIQDLEDELDEKDKETDKLDKTRKKLGGYLVLSIIFLVLGWWWVYITNH